MFSSGLLQRCKIDEIEAIGEGEGGPAKAVCASMQAHVLQKHTRHSTYMA